MLYLILLCLLLLFIVFLIWCFSWIVSYVLARVFRCTRVKLGRFGLFSLSHLKLIFSKHLSLELHSIKLSSSFFNQEYTKPIVLTVGDVRIELGADLLPKQNKSTNENDQRGDSENKFGKILNWLQYLSLYANQVQLVVFDAVVPGCVLHLALEDIIGDVYRDRHKTQAEISCRLITGKLMRRSGGPSRAPDSTWLHLSLQTNITCQFDTLSSAPQLVCVSLTDPLLNVSEALLHHFAELRNEKESEGLEIKEEVKPVKSKSMRVAEINVTTNNFNLHFTPLGSDRACTTCVRKLDVTARCLNEPGFPTLLLLFEQATISDSAGLAFRFAKLHCHSEKEENSEQVNCQVFLENPAFDLAQDDLGWWCNNISRMVDCLKSPNKEVVQKPPIRKSKVHLQMEMTDVQIYLLPTQLALPIRLIAQFVSITTKARIFEIGCEGIVCRRLRQRSQPNLTTIDKYSQHELGCILAIDALLFRLHKSPKGSKIQLQADDCHFEYEVSLLELALNLYKTISALFVPSSVKKESRSSKSLCVDAGITSLSVVLPLHNNSVVSFICISKLSLLRKSDASVVADSHKLRVGYCNFVKHPKTNLNSALTNNAYCLATVHKINIEKMTEVFNITCPDMISITWTPELHLAVYSTLSYSKTALQSAGFIHPLPQENPAKKPNLLYFNVDLQKQIVLQLKLPNDRRIEIFVDNLKLQSVSSTKATSLVVPGIRAEFDGKQILSMSPLELHRLFSHPKLNACRSEFKLLTTKHNQLWAFFVGKFLVSFPYNYEFAGCYEEMLNTYKWLKIIHGINKAEFTAQSPLPLDLFISINTFSLEICDDPFEVKLRCNYELMLDEAYESERRKQMLDTKLEGMRKSNPLFPRPGTKVDELYKTLWTKNSQIYVNRSQQMGALRSQLLSWTVSQVQIIALADKSLHGRDAVLRFMKSCDQKRNHFTFSSRVPTEAEFITHWARAVQLDFSQWVVHLRDYPHPYMNIKEGHFWGKLAGAEQLGSERSRRTCTVDLGLPWGSYKIKRNMPPLKFFYDLGCEMGEGQFAYGPCWEPCLAMANLCMNKVNKPSLDPSPPLPFWDKIRYLFHGRLSVMCGTLTSIMLASPDPYNTTEQLEISWNNFCFDWTDGLILMTADVNAFVRTASKYDDVRLLSLPALKLSVQMDWACLGDKWDHYSVAPCAPDKLPEFSLNQDHDSYRPFRSQHLTVGLKLEMKDPGEGKPDSQYPQLLLYANTIRWLNTLKNTLSAVNRPVKRGELFSNARVKRAQLSRHWKSMEFTVSLPRFIISYWMSFSSDHGFRVCSRALQLKSNFHLAIQPSQDELSRRAQVQWKVGHVSVELLDAEIFLYSKFHNQEDISFTDCDKSRSFFVGLSRISYKREEAAAKSTANMNSDEASVHHLLLYDLKGAWTKANRDTILAIFDQLQKSRMLRKNLSTDAVKILTFSEDKPTTSNNKRSTSNTTHSPPPSGRLEASQAASMLQQLIDEQNTKFVAYSEETTERPTDQLHGVEMCEMNDVMFCRWHIELVNSQVVLKGVETGGFVVCTAARARVTQRVHHPVWREAQLLGKRSWVALLSGMQYFAPLMDDKGSKGSDLRADFKWLPRELIEEKSCSDPSLDAPFESYISAGDAVGGVVAQDVPSICGQQLQRVISRCSCQAYFCYFSDTFDLEDDELMPPPPTEEDERDFWNKREYVDCFTLKHNMLDISSNSRQHRIIIDIINNLVLYIDPRKKDQAEKRMRLRFKLQVQTLDDLRPVILEQQNEIRRISSRLRSLEKQVFHICRQMQENPNDDNLLETNKGLEEEMDRCKTLLMAKSEDLAMSISCFKEKQVRHVKQMARLSDDQLAPIARRFEVCFEDAHWRMTEQDGQLGIADLQIRNFLYTKILRINSSGEHLVELGSIHISNLLPTAKWREVLQAQHQSSLCAERQPAIRVACRELAPVGGIPVKEHFEVNVSPMVVQMTYPFFRAIMFYFFPGRNIDKADQQNLDTVEEDKNPPKDKVVKTLKLGAKKKDSKHADEIDKMKERADKNNMFLYIKIPEVPFMVSYKGEKEKNLEDVENFQLMFPLVEYHEKNWTWLDLALAVKQRCKRVLVQQFMKQKLFTRRPGQAIAEASSIPDEEKIRIVLGTNSSSTPNKNRKATSLLSRRN